jgi:hypothetical protein
MIITPRIFISYSWTTPNHESWVINLAERLVADGVDVSIDKWDLKEGQDKFDFMETMVKSSEIEKVLIILDKKYTEKADVRSGGVGAETQIISPKIYENVSQEKFIPIVSERSEEGNPFIPTYLNGRIYIDLSEQQLFEENYERLLRNIFKTPIYNKPKLGKAPDYLFEDTPMNHKTSSIIRSFDNQIEKNPSRGNSILRQFLDEFYENLKAYEISFSSREATVYGKEICDNINAYTPLRNDFILFFDKLIKSEVKFDIEIIIRFLERLPLLTSPQDNRTSNYAYDYENFKFFIHELFLYLIAVGVKNESYQFIEELLLSSYFLQEKYANRKEPEMFTSFYHHIQVIDNYYNQAYSSKFHSPMADLIIKRIPENFTKTNLINADLICHYIAELNNVFWLPITYIYRERGRFEIFDRLISLRHFEKVKILFGVSTVKELKDKLSIIQKNDRNSQPLRYSSAYDSIAPIYKAIEVEKIATTR